MPNFHLAWRAFPGAGEAGLLTTPPAAARLTTLTRLAVLAQGADEAPAALAAAASPAEGLDGLGPAGVLCVFVDPNALTLTAAAGHDTRHYYRLADGTVKPLPPTPPPLPCRAGDAYIAVTPAAARLAAPAPGGASAAIARFLHLRDYFNAEKLAGALLAHVVELGADADAAGVGVLVVEVR